MPCEAILDGVAPAQSGHEAGLGIEDHGQTAAPLDQPHDP